MSKTKQILIDGYNAHETKFFLVNSDNKLEEFLYQNTNKKTIKGNIYLGKVSRIEPSLQAAFIDYGAERKGFLSFDMIHPKNYKIPVACQDKVIKQLQNESKDNSEENSDTEESKQEKTYKIQEVLKKDQVVLVQVDKEERDNKGAFLTTFISISGRYCVFSPNSLRIGASLSRRVDEAEERERLLDMSNNLIKDYPDASLILRTASALRTKAEITRDFEYLTRIWENIKKTTTASFAPALIHEEGELIVNCIKNFYTSDVNKIVVYGNQAYSKVKEFLEIFIPNNLDKLHEYKKSNPIVYEYKLDKQFTEFYSNKVMLNSGGYLIINCTEALISIDVNSGKYTEEFSIENTALNINLEATKEIARQVKFRNLSGLIVIDFIDMNELSNKKVIEKSLKNLFWHDRAKVQMSKISEFGLLEMSRQRIGRSFLESNTTNCTSCKGRGKVMLKSSVASLVLDKLRSKLANKQAKYAMIFTSSDIVLHLTNSYRDEMSRIEKETKVKVILHIDDFHAPEDFKIKLDTKYTNHSSNIYFSSHEESLLQLKNLENHTEKENYNNSNNFKQSQNNRRKKKHQKKIQHQKQQKTAQPLLNKFWAKIKKKV
jgi:ribonuclease E